ncbi:hypothetical protein BUE64_01925 [Corynebacterium diphtheriae subsp. lausannense]|nr:hypothetical protein BUE64_01925 [Corynebacterium diphtheriae subsp. lausannense]QBZ29988.1 hypothetical protein E4653_09310 [Corynebacterium diphtheriae subsp. lausannense]
MTMTDRARREASHRSRDLSTGSTTGTQTLTYDRSGSRAGYNAQRVEERPLRSRSFRNTAGSRQVFSHRGRRNEAPRAAVAPANVRRVVGIIVMLVSSVAVSLYLSGISTEQTFAMTQLCANENTLSNQIETLNRDVENASSTANIARRAQEMGLVVPDQAGILLPQPEGEVIVQREPGEKTHPVVDVNGDRIAPKGASSDPNKTSEVAGNLNAVPPVGNGAPAANGGAGVASNGVNTGANESANGSVVAPYAPTVHR